MAQPKLTATQELLLHQVNPVLTFSPGSSTPQTPKPTTIYFSGGRRLSGAAAAAVANAAQSGAYKNGNTSVVIQPGCVTPLESYPVSPTHRALSLSSGDLSSATGGSSPNGQAKCPGWGSSGARVVPPSSNCATIARPEIRSRSAWLNLIAQGDLQPYTLPLDQRLLASSERTRQKTLVRYTADEHDRTWLARRFFQQRSVPFSDGNSESLEGCGVELGDPSSITALLGGERETPLASSASAPLCGTSSIAESATVLNHSFRGKTGQRQPLQCVVSRREGDCDGSLGHAIAPNPTHGISLTVLEDFITLFELMSFEHPEVPLERLGVDKLAAVQTLATASTEVVNVSQVAESSVSDSEVDEAKKGMAVTKVPYGPQSVKGEELGARVRGEGRLPTTSTLLSGAGASVRLDPTELIDEIRRYWIGKRHAYGGGIPLIPALHVVPREENQSTLCSSEILEDCPLPFKARDWDVMISQRKNHKTICMERETGSQRRGRVGSAACQCAVASNPHRESSVACPPLKVVSDSPEPLPSPPPVRKRGRPSSQANTAAQEGAKVVAAIVLQGSAKKQTPCEVCKAEARRNSYNVWDSPVDGQGSPLDGAVSVIPVEPDHEGSGIFFSNIDPDEMRRRVAAQAADAPLYSSKALKRTTSNAVALTRALVDRETLKLRHTELALYELAVLRLAAAESCSLESLGLAAVNRGHSEDADLQRVWVATPTRAECVVGVGTLSLE